MPRGKRTKKPVEVGVPAEVIETEKAMSGLEAMTPDKIRHIPDEPLDGPVPASDVFDAVIAASRAKQAEPEQPKVDQQHSHEHRQFNGRGLIGFHTPRGTVRVVDESGMVGIQMDEKPSAEELKNSTGIAGR